MWIESRRLLTLVGDQKITIASFAALLLYGVVLLLHRDRRSMRASLMLGVAAAWLLAVLMGAISGDLAIWSSLAVFLFAIGAEAPALPRSRPDVVPRRRSGSAPPHEAEPQLDALDKRLRHFGSSSYPTDGLIDGPLSS